MNDEELFASTHPEFTVTCNKCGSTRVYVENTVGCSAESGMWGSVDLVCADCDNTTTVFES